MSRNSRKATHCLNLIVHGNINGIIFANETAIDSKILQESADRTSISLYQNIHFLVDGEIGSDGYFREREWQRHGNNEFFAKWAKFVLMETIMNQTSPDILLLLEYLITFITEELSGAWKHGVNQNDTIVQW